MELNYHFPDYKKVRVIIDTDAANEADDPFAIAHALMSQKFCVKGIVATHFKEENSTKRSYDEIKTILEAMDIEVPVFMGENGPLQTLGSELSEGTEFIIKEALKEDQRPLYVLCLGAITNVARAIEVCGDIVNRMTVVWIGGQSFDHPSQSIREFNSGNDIKAANIVASSGTDLWMIPYNVYITMLIGLAEIQQRIYPCGKIGKHLFEQMDEYNNSERAHWTAGESWSLGDSPAVGVVLEQNNGTYEYREAPIFLEDTTYRFEEGRPMIRVYTSINSRFILEDFIAKLQLLYTV